MVERVLEEMVVVVYQLKENNRCKQCYVFYGILWWPIIYDFQEILLFNVVHVLAYTLSPIVICGMESDFKEFYEHEAVN